MKQNQEELAVYREIMEERLKIQHCEMEARLLVEQYRNKVRQAQQEKQDIDKEINKLKNILETKTGHEFDKKMVSQVFVSTLQQSGLQFFPN